MSGQTRALCRLSNSPRHASLQMWLPAMPLRDAPQSRTVNVLPDAWVTAAIQISPDAEAGGVGAKSAVAATEIVLRFLPDRLIDTPAG
jgi:hypothetical protein